MQVRFTDATRITDDYDYCHSVGRKLGVLTGSGRAGPQPMRFVGNNILDSSEPESSEVTASRFCFRVFS
jgi:hypothetical protein